ncbi:hypothetical protein [Shewanella sp. UCD-KL12]|uniref:hypothetical protein n=1 Tax=Shewanella sp. UCD-KL12 TaxID=1917163 RepID=UPI0009706122|nr:hypothetical protein [Shewanella sp. UCD-KL12]
MFKAFISLLLFITLSGCSNTPEEQQFYHRIDEAYDFEVTHCDSFAMARGKGVGEFALRDAKMQAMSYGEEIGGTHIVWLQVDEGGEGEETKVVAVIYKCLR